MRSDLATPRSSDLVRTDLAQVESIINDAPAARAGDVAAEAQWRAWRNHHAALKEELAEAVRVEAQLAGNENAIKDVLHNVIGKVRLFFASKGSTSSSKREAVLHGGEKNRDH